MTNELFHCPKCNADITEAAKKAVYGMAGRAGRGASKVRSPEQTRKAAAASVAVRRAKRDSRRVDQ